jgi:N-methylhydantoinase B/oxoprolinase/acetone carboxylase alpha subunit
MREAIEKLRPGSLRYETDSGQAIVVRIDIDQATKRVHVDFTGTSAQDPHNFNAPRAVLLAASQGTMNNLTFGDERLPYYETIAGGAGAGPEWSGRGRGGCCRRRATIARGGRNGGNRRHGEF